MTDMPLSSAAEGTYLECGFFASIEPTPSGLCPAAGLFSPLVAADAVPDSHSLSVLLRFGPVKQLIPEKGLLMRRLWKFRGIWSAVALFITLGGAILSGTRDARDRGLRFVDRAARSSPLGFMPGSREGQLKAEAHALAVPTPENARSWLRVLTAEPHVAGTPADYKTAVFVRDKLREWGWKAELEELEVLLNYPAPGSPPSLNITGLSTRAYP